ncbi:MAG: ribonuclease III family protein [Okeania sp. SIO2D1]|nr:ribonuclease III family protein [Okeania sp. SIO2D1]
MQDSYLRHWLQEKLDIEPQDLRPYRQAVTTQQYEVLEFFGDSVLGFIVAEYLVKKYDFIDQPGWFTRVKAKLVKNQTLAQVAQQIDLATVATIPSTSSREQISGKVTANMLEALIGAVYLEFGLPKTQELITKLLDLDTVVLEYLTTEGQNSKGNIRQTRKQVEIKIKKKIIATAQSKNPISALQEFLAKKGESPPEYLEIKRSGEPHNLNFTIEARCQFQGQILVGEGEGKKLKEAKQSAAQTLLTKVLQLFEKS